METIKLNDGNEMPLIGFGVFMIENGGPTKEAVLKALKAGYRLIDTAAAYYNETDVGEAIKESGIPREEIFVTSKLWLQDYGYQNAKKGIETSLEKLGLDYIDLYLLHQPYGDTKGAWKALEEAKKEGKIKSIGISNHSVKFLNELLPYTEIKPAINQMEYNPLFQEKEVRSVMEKDDIKLEAWFPLGHGNSELFTNSIITKIAEKYNKSAVQVILRFETQEGVVTIPSAKTEEHIKQNIDIFDFKLTDEEMNEMRSLDTGKGTHNPDDMSNFDRLNELKVHD